MYQNHQIFIQHAVAETTTCRTTKYKDLTNKLITSTTTTDRPKKIERPKVNFNFM